MRDLDAVTGPGRQRRRRGLVLKRVEAFVFEVCYQAADAASRRQIVELHLVGSLGVVVVARGHL